MPHSETKKKDKKMKKRNGKPTAFQIETLKKSGIPNVMNGIKTYRDAENAIRRIKRQKKRVKADVKPSKPDSKKETANKKPTAKNPQVRSVGGIGVFRVKLDKSDVLAALMLGFAKAIVEILDEK